MAKKPQTRADRFASAFTAAQEGQGNYEAWSDFVRLYAYEIAERCGNRNEGLKQVHDLIVEKSSEERIGNFMEMFALLIEEMAETPFVDAFGKLYMESGIGDKAGGQYFSPINITSMMADMYSDEYITDTIESRGYIAVNDPACGGGQMLLAFARRCEALDVDYASSVWFVGQDKNELSLLMCYIQMSIMGMAGAVVLGDVLKGEEAYHMRTPKALINFAWTKRYLAGAEIPWFIN